MTLSDSKLTVTLKDYADWAIFSNFYTEDDIGREIHKKMDLSDVFNAFSQTKTNNDEENMRVK